MTLLLDTHVLLWALAKPDGLSKKIRSLLDDPKHELWFSTISIWEISIKASRKGAKLEVDPAQFRRDLLTNDYKELVFTGVHALGIRSLPPIHNDPFDRALLAQAQEENMRFLTRDSALCRYPGNILVV